MELQLNETVDVHRFIMGEDWPVKDLLKRGFVQDTRSEYTYARQLRSCVVEVALLGGVDTVSNNAVIDVQFESARNRTLMLWSAIVPFSLLGKFLDIVLGILEPLPEGYLVLGNNEHVIYGQLEAHTEKSEFVEAIDPKEFIQQQGGFFEFKAKLKELGWFFLKLEVTPTIHGTTVDVHHFEKIIEPYRHSGDTGPSQLDCYASEFSEDGKRRISVYGRGARMEMTDEMDHQGDPLKEEKTWSTEEFIQPDDMTPTLFAELVDDELATSEPFGEP